MAGNNLDRIHRTTRWPPAAAPHREFVPLASAIRKLVTVPVFTVGRIVDPARADPHLWPREPIPPGLTNRMPPVPAQFLAQSGWREGTSVPSRRRS